MSTQATPFEPTSQKRLTVTTLLAPASESTLAALGQLQQQTAQGGGWLFADSSYDLDTLERVKRMALDYGRASELQVVDFIDPKVTSTYSPLNHAAPEVLALRFLGLLPDVKDSPGADFYRQQAHYAMTTIFAALQAANQHATFLKITALMDSVAELHALEALVPRASPAFAALQGLLDSIKVGQAAESQMSSQKLKAVVGGMAGRIAQLAQGRFGSVFNSDSPDVDLVDVVRHNTMVYIMLPHSGHSASPTVGRLISSDLDAAVAKVKALPESKHRAHAFIRCDW